MATHAWNYNDQGSWKDLPDCQAAGKRQSPIDIITSVSEKDKSLGPVRFHGNFDKYTGTWTNNGHSLQFEPQFGAGSTPFIEIPNAVEHPIYDLKQFHFHWGSKKGEGSEHCVDSQSSDAELHFVHKKRAISATTDADHLTVLGVLLVSDPHLPMTGIWEKLKHVPKFQETITLEDVNVKELIPSTRSYWHYEGSLTTPPCSEIVQWFVFMQKISIPEAVLQEWRRLPQDAQGNPLMQNHRHIQDLNDRKVVAYLQ